MVRYHGIYLKLYFAHKNGGQNSGFGIIIMPGYNFSKQELKGNIPLPVKALPKLTSQPCLSRGDFHGGREICRVLGQPSLPPTQQYWSILPSYTLDLPIYHLKPCFCRGWALAPIESNGN